MANALFVVWRECLEAFLVIGILYGWLVANGGGQGRWLVGSARTAMMGGVLGGLVLALLLGWSMLFVQDELAGERLEMFQTAILLVAALLITHMVLWMRRHGRQMRQQMHLKLSRASERSGYWGVALVVALAIAREGAETVIFLYGLSQSGDTTSLFLGAVAGFVAALATAAVVAMGLVRLNFSLVLSLSSWVLLLLASALLVAGVDRMIGNGWLPPMIEPVWDSSALLDDGEGAGQWLADFAGYRARPALLTLLAWGGFWLLVLFAQRKNAND